MSPGSVTARMARSADGLRGFKILYLAPDLFLASGGISRYCRLVVKALTESRLVDELDVVSLRDPAESQPEPRYWNEGRRASYLACGGNRAAFSRAAAKRMFGKPYSHVLSGHVYLTPLPFLFSRLRSARLVTFAYGLDVTSRLPWFRRVPLNKSAQVIAITQFTADLMARANAVPARNIRLLHNCLDPVFVENHSGSDGSSTTLPQFGPNAILTVSRLSRADAYKGHDAVLRALPAVLVHVPDARYYIVGRGELRLELEQKVEALGLRDHVVFLGAVSDAELACCYQMARVFVMPSKAEGFGFVFLEAMAYGRPIVAGNRDAAPEVLGHGEAGLLVDPDDTAELAQAITRILVEPDLGVRLGAAGRGRVERQFSYSLFKQRLEAYLAEPELDSADDKS